MYWHRVYTPPPPRLKVRSAEMAYLFGLKTKTTTKDFLARVCTTSFSRVYRYIAMWTGISRRPQTYCTWPYIFAYLDNQYPNVEDLLKGPLSAGVGGKRYLA